MPKISIVMPVYNSAKYLREAINSILEQTFTDWEFIIINELGSDDGSREIIEQYAEIDNRIILVQNDKRLGIAASMNVGFDMANGEYVARMDADDISLPDRFEKQIEFMDSNPDIGMCGTKVLIFGSNAFEWELETDKDKLDTNILFYSPSVHPTVMIRKSLVDKYNLRYNPEFKASEDYELFSKICEVSKIANIDEVLFKYRIMENNATFKNNDIGLILYSKVMEDQFKKMGLNFTDEEIKLLSPHYSMKGAKYEEVLERFINLDLLLKKILVVNEECRLYDRKYLSNTLHKRFTEAYNSISWACKNYDKNKVDEFYRKSIFTNEFFYKGYAVKKDFQPVVTVLMPAFNSEKYIADTIWSVLNQSYKNFELLIVNEFGSDDSTIKIINMFNDERIRVIQNKEKLGLAESLNLGIREAKGKYIARIDADDLCDIDRLKLQVEFMEKNLEYGVCGSWQHHFGINTDWIHKPSILHEDLKAEFIYNCELCHSTLMLRKSFFIDNDLFYNKNSAAEDYELWTRAIHKFKFSNLPRVLGEYRIGEDNITAKKLKALSEESANIAFKNITTYLNVNIPEEHIKYLTSWFNEFNNIKDKRSYKHAINTEKEILKQMWINNQNIKAYSEDSLLRVINRRWRMVTNSWVHGTEMGEILPIDDLFNVYGKSEDMYSQAKTIRTQKGIKKYLKGVIMFLYRPFKYKIIDRIRQQLWDLDGHLKESTAQVRETVWDLEGHLKDEIDNTRNEIMNTNNEITIIKQMLFESLNSINKKIEKTESNILQTLDGRVWKAELNIIEMQEKYAKVLNKFNSQNKEKKIILINTPEYSNLGDHAIAMAEIKFLKDHFKEQIVELTGTFYRENQSVIKEYINEQDLILITGGGYLGTLWFYEEETVRKIIMDHPNNAIVILPQTIYYSDDEYGHQEFENSKKIYNSHNNLTLCARDKISFEIMKEAYHKSKVILMPDMVLYYDKIDTSYNREGILLCLKNDKESILKLNDKENLKQMAKKFSSVVTFTDTNLDFNVPRESREKYVSEKLIEFKKAQLVITDRLHGMIFSAITNTPCVAIDNCNYKVRETYEWLDKIEYIKYSNNVNNIEEYVENLMNKKNCQYDNSSFMPHFNKLVEVIKEFL